ncbi:MAG: DNA-binding response OmpR family regulator [Verrucomicrobiales bacterium]|jgi:DNA-binding response OmpR family regulator
MPWDNARTFSRAELLARVRALLHRAEQCGKQVFKVLKIGDATIDFIQMTKRCSGHDPYLAPKKFGGLRLLAEADAGLAC